MALTREQNDALTRVGPGTPGGEMLRRYWWPVWFTEELKAKPIPVRLLGEDFVLFRDGSGKAGLVDVACPHRGAALTLGRCEANGIRCCYHGWLFDRDGQCVEQPAEPPGSKLHQEVKIKAGAVEEAGGLIFANIGPKPVPLLPRYDLAFREDCDRAVWSKDDHCNWVQRAENGVDPYHSMSLHASVYPSMAMKRPEVTQELTWYGFRNSSEYPGGKRNVSHHIFPSTTRRHGARTGTIPSEYLHLRVPIDDITTRTFYIKANMRPNGPYKLETRGHKPSERGVYKRVEDGWWDIPSEEQDRAAQESQGLIHDRTREFLATSDRGIIQWRKLMFESIEAVRQGKDPHGIVRDLSRADIIHFDAGKNFSDHDKPPTSANVAAE